MSRTITAFYDSASDAQRAQEQLLSLGLRDGEVRVVNQGTQAPEYDAGDKGIWESIKDFFVADDDRLTYSEGLRRGGYLLTARVADERTDEVIAILEQSNPVDLDRRVDEWRSEGWTGSQAVGAAYDMSSVPAATGAHLDEVSRRGELEAGAREQAIPIVTERLKVGKREVERGGVRVRSYIVEEPVNEQVELREERVDVERRPVRGQVSGDASDLLQERTIEVTERAEEAIVAKEAEVTEEVVVRKFEGHRTEGVSDTVRHTEVDVEDTRSTDPAARPKRDTLRRPKTSEQKPRR